MAIYLEKEARDSPIPQGLVLGVQNIKINAATLFPRSEERVDQRSVVGVS
jgi:hypothetical protein